MWDLTDFIELSVLVVAIPVIAKWRGVGALAYIILGWTVVFLSNRFLPLHGWDDIEFAEDWPFVGWFLLAIWSLLIYSVVALWRWLRRRRQCRG
jgi:hypothetical protein